MLSAVYQFNRSKDGSGFLSQNRPSTDALNALEGWTEGGAGKQGRSYEVVNDEDEFLVAKLSWNEADIEAGPDLDAQCRDSGIEKKFQRNYYHIDV